jgi:protein SCO1/2
LPVLFQVPSFAFTDQDGATFKSDEKLRGKVWAANFVFTRCPTICPLFTKKMAEVQQGAAPLDDSVRLVSFTVDPAYDTPAVLKAYADKHHAKAGLWSFLTGTHEQLKKTIVTDLKIHMTDESDDIMAIAHGGHFVLVDGEMNVRGYYNSEDEDAVQRLVADMTKLVKENG